MLRYFKAFLDYVRQQGIYIYRGDPANVDYTQATLTQDGAWHDLNLSALVPEHAKAVDVSILFINTANAKVGWFKRKGQANDRNASVISSHSPNQPQAQDLTIALDTNRTCEYKFDADGWTYIALTVKGWWY